MQAAVRSIAMPELKQVLAEASRSLALLDADRLEELAASCQRFNRELQDTTRPQQRRLQQHAREASADLAVLARVLEATRANLSVMHRLQELRHGSLEYGRTLSAPTEANHGNH